MNEVKKIIITICFSFMSGALCAGFIAYRFYQSKSGQYRSQFDQYRKAEQRFEKRIGELQSANTRQSNIITQLETNERTATAEIERSFKSIGSSENSVSEIRNSIQCIRKALSVLEKNRIDFSISGNDNNDNNDSSNSGK